MAEWEELCVLSGIGPGGGPRYLLDKSKVDETASAMACEIQNLTLADDATPSLTEHDLRHIVEEALTIAITGDDDDGYRPGVPTWFSDHIISWLGMQRCIAIGHFVGWDGECPQEWGTYNNFGEWTPGPARIPLGDNVEVRIVDSYQNCGKFSTVIVRLPDGEEDTDEKSDCNCATNNGIGNVFVLEGCWIYLQAWLDVSLPPSLSSCSGEPLSLAGEFYEIVNSRKERRKFFSRAVGALPAIEYGGIEDTCDNLHHDYQNYYLGARADSDYFLGARAGSGHVARAIYDGLRGVDLMDALKMDFGCWMAASPDQWPFPPSSLSWTPPIYPQTGRQTLPNGFTSLPTELFLDILHFLTIPDLLRFACTSKSTWNIILEPRTFSLIIREALFHGALRWVLPVNGAYDETERMDDVARKWLSTHGTLSDDTISPQASIHGVVTPLASLSFPHYAFLRECYKSDSMMNRKRLWGIVKQFDAIWTEYRLNGWERDIFYVG